MISAEVATFECLPSLHELKMIVDLKRIAVRVQLHAQSAATRLRGCYQRGQAHSLNAGETREEMKKLLGAGIRDGQA